MSSSSEMKQCGEISTDGLKEIHVAVISNKIPKITLLLASGTSVDETDMKGRTALHIAAILGNAAAAKVLLKNGADPNKEDDRGATPMYYAASKEDPETLIP